MRLRTILILTVVLPFVLAFQQCPPPGIPFDFDDDGVADLSVFRPSDGSWWVYQTKSSAPMAVYFGMGTDKVVPADYTGDGKTDFAVFRDGIWYVMRSDDMTYYGYQFGLPGDIPVPAQFEPPMIDIKADMAVYRPSEGMWYIQRTFSGGSTSYVRFGLPEDKPVVADYDGDKIADIAVYRPSEGQWYVLRSRDQQVTYTRFGISTDKPVPADYTGDGVADIAVYRPPTGEWFVLRSEDLSYYSIPFGKDGDMPAAADFDGDGKVNLAVFRPDEGNWYILDGNGELTVKHWGMAGDQPLPNAFVH